MLCFWNGVCGLLRTTLAAEWQPENGLGPAEIMELVCSSPRLFSWLELILLIAEASAVKASPYSSEHERGLL